MNIRTTVSLLFISLVLTTACTVQPKLPLPPDNPPLPAVQSDPAGYKNKMVTWGGMIIETEVKKQETWLVILAKPLDSTAEPRPVDHSLGRFLAVHAGFRDPAVFANGRNITVTGKISGMEKRKIGEHDYVYPVVQVEQFYLWPVRQPADWYDDYWYDPWFDPWYGPYWYPRSYFYLHHRHYIE